MSGEWISASAALAFYQARRPGADGETDLLGLLQTGQLPARGQKAVGGKVEPVPATLWRMDMPQAHWSIGRFTFQPAAEYDHEAASRNTWGAVQARLKRARSPFPAMHVDQPVFRIPAATEFMGVQVDSSMLATLVSSFGSIAGAGEASDGKSRGGRTRAKGWEDWTAALAVLVHGGKILAGMKDDHVREIIANKMGAWGLDEMPRSTTQAVVKVVLRRLKDDANDPTQ